LSAEREMKNCTSNEITFLWVSLEKVLLE